MRRKSFGMIAVGVMCAMLATPASAYPSETVEEPIRTHPEPMEILVLVPQIEIRTAMNAYGPDGGGGAPQGGLVGAVIAGAIDSSRAGKAEDRFAQMRIVMESYDADAVARSETARAFSAIKWANSAQMQFAKDPTVWNKIAVIDKAKGRYLLAVDYSYELSADFSSVIVYAYASIADKLHPKAKTPEKRFLPERLLFSRGTHVQVQLPVDPARTREDAMKIWTKDDSKLLKDSIAMGLSKAADLSARVVAMTPAEMAALSSKDKPKIMLGYHRGRLVEGAESLSSVGADNALLPLLRKSAVVAPGGAGALLWSGLYFAHVRTLELPK